MGSPPHQFVWAGRIRPAAFKAESGLDIGPPLGMSAQVPARQQPGMRKQCIDAALRARRIENKLRPAILLQHSVVTGYDYRSVGMVVRGVANPKHTEVDSKHQSRQCQQSQGGSYDDATDQGAPGKRGHGRLALYAPRGRRPLSCVLPLRPKKQGYALGHRRTE